jgi:hypothetical protein
MKITKQQLMAAIYRPGMFTGEQNGRMHHEWQADAVIAMEANEIESVRLPDNKPVVRASPECGDDRHLYQQGADVSWDPETFSWEASGEYDNIECTSCDWTGTEDDTEVKADAPAPA